MSEGPPGPHREAAAGAHERMSDIDKILWVIEGNPQLRSTITAVLFFDRDAPAEVVRARVDAATRRVIRLRERVVSHPYSIAPPRWEIDPAFHLDDHLRWVTDDGARTRRAVFDLAQQIAVQRFDIDHPLWELTVVDGVDGGGMAMIAKLHHTMTDGVGGVELMLALFDLERDPGSRPAAPELPEARVLGPAARVAAALRHEVERQRALTIQALGETVELIVDPLDATRRRVETARSALRMARPTVHPRSPVLQARSLAVAFDAIERPLAAFRDAGRTCEASVNDVFVTGLCRGLDRWHRELGVPVRELRMGMPLNARPLGESRPATSRFLPTRFEVPLAIDDVRDHLRAVHDLVRAQRDEPALGVLEPLAAVVSRLPRTVVTNLFSQVLRGQDFLASNVAGAPIPVFFAGAELTDIVAFGPLGGAALNVTLLSHCGTVQLAVAHDPAAVVDRAQLLRCLAEGLDEVLALGTPPPAPRRRRAPRAEAEKPRRHR